MDLNKLYEKQAKLDKHILEKHNIKMSKEELLANTTLALLVEVGELANTTRCFKHWSTKGMMDKEIVIEELADCWHFYLSIGNQMNLRYSNTLDEREYEDKLISMYHQYNNNYEYIIVDTFKRIYKYILDMRYEMIGVGLQIIQYYYDFTNEEVEQAYLKKHEENYKRQREGY